MAVHANDDYVAFQTALSSTLEALADYDEMLVIADGQLTEDHMSVIQSIEDFRLRFYSKKWAGPADAWNMGIQLSTNEWIARMDADDVCCRDRFDIQKKSLMANDYPDLLGSSIVEFDPKSANSDKIRQHKNGPIRLTNDLILRCKIYHVTCIYRKSAVINAGLYRQFTNFVDYDLWIRMESIGCKLFNTSDVVVRVRAGSSLASRRRGLKYLINEISFFNEHYSMRRFTLLQYLLSLSLRTLVRIAPSFVVNFFYSVR
jgi:glycosyltransferase involved in cell wall biosynthesis